MSFAARQHTSSLSGLVSITDQNADNDSLSGIGGTATATYRLASTGVASATNPAGVLTAISGEWRLSGASADYEAQATWGSGTGTTGGPTGWVSLSTTRDWTLTATDNTVSRPLTVEIRLASGAILLDTATITFSVDSAP